jgi:hypothetical protein
MIGGPRPEGSRIREVPPQIGNRSIGRIVKKACPATAPCRRGVFETPGRCVCPSAGSAKSHRRRHTFGLRRGMPARIATRRVAGAATPPTVHQSRFHAALDAPPALRNAYTSAQSSSSSKRWKASSPISPRLRNWSSVRRSAAMARL